jgi:hypothetical protein
VDRDEERAIPVAGYELPKTLFGIGPIEEAIGVRSRRRPLSRLKSRVICPAAIGGLLLANYVIFRAFGSNFPRWYLHNAAVLSLAFAFFALTVDLDRDPDLVAARPNEYIGAWTGVLSEVIFAWRRGMIPSKEPERPTQVLDEMIAVVFAYTIIIALTGWVIVIAPAQYVVNLFCGAPVRSARRGGRALWARRDVSLDIVETPVGQKAPLGGFVQVGYWLKPVTFTNTLAAAIFWLISMVD